MKKLLLFLLSIIMLGSLSMLAFIFYSGPMPDSVEDARSAVVTTITEGPAALQEKRKQDNLKEVMDGIRKDGGEIIQSFMFDSFDTCRTRAEQVAAEYQRRGVTPDKITNATDMAGKNNYLIQITEKDGADLNISCISDDKRQTTAYVLFRLR